MLFILARWKALMNTCVSSLFSFAFCPPLKTPSPCFEMANEMAACLNSCSPARVKRGETGKCG